MRAFIDGDLALDTQHGVLVWEPRRIVPVYAVPEDDLLVAHAGGVPPPAEQASADAERLELG